MTATSDEGTPERIRKLAEAALTLPEGRQLAWAEWGDPDGTPLFHFHGVPGSRLEHPVGSASRRQGRGSLDHPQLHDRAQNILFLALAAALVLRSLRTGVREMLRHMG
ncbi:MAG: hypothetical protein ACRDZ1_00670 [Acidimicrobiia bacterium]